MFATGFDESNCVLSKPQGFTDEECSCLSVHAGNQPNGLPVVISCWKLTQQELDEINRTGRVWLGVLGQTMPPCWLLGVSPFTKPEGTNDENASRESDQ